MSHHLESLIARQDICLPRPNGHRVCHQRLPLDFWPYSCAWLPSRRNVEFKVDLNGDAVEDITYRVTFNERDQQGKQSYVVCCIRGAEAVDPHAPGDVVAVGTTGELVTAASGLHVWAGKAGDPFWIEPDVLHADMRFKTARRRTSTAGNQLAQKTCLPGTRSIRLFWKCRIAICSPAQALSGVSVCVSTLATDAGGWPSVNRVGLSMIHPLFTQSSTAFPYVPQPPGRIAGPA